MEEDVDMLLEILRSGAPEPSESPPGSAGGVRVMNRVDSVEAEIRAVCLDSKDDDDDASSTSSTTLTKLLRFCGDSDSVLQVNDTAVEMETDNSVQLSPTRKHPNWNQSDISIKGLVVYTISKKDLSTVKPLSDKTKTKDIAEAASDKVNDSQGSKEKMTVYECHIREREALARGRSTPPLELLQLFRATGGADKNVMTSSLIREARAGDEALIQLLRKKNVDVNDAEMYSCSFHDQTHTDGSSALDQILQLSRLWCPQQINRLCFYADCEESAKANKGEHQSHVSAAQRLKRKLFIGGLPPSVDSEFLGKLFEQFGSVENSVVIVAQAAENKIKSQGFGFVLFKEEKSVLAAVQSLKAVSKGKFEIKMDHASKGYSKLSDLMEYFSNLCSIKTLPISKCGPPADMLLPNVRPTLQHRLIHTLATSDTISFSASMESCGHFKRLENHFCLPDHSVSDSGDTKCILDLSICNVAEQFGSSTNYDYPEVSSAKNKSYYEHPRFLQFFKSDPQLRSQKELGVLVTEFTNEKRQCSIWDRAKGTTNIAVRLDEDIILGWDSRITYAGLRRDTETKFTKITPKILVTMAGNVCECKKTWKQMKEHVSENVLEGEEPTSIQEIANVVYNMERSKEAGPCECFIVGVQNENPEIHYLLDEYDEGLKKRRKVLEEIKGFAAIGSGGIHVFEELEKKLNDPKRKLSLEEAIELVKSGLLQAALLDIYTGGPLWVVHVNSEGITIKSENNVVGLYVRFYDQFREIEETSIFLFYIPEINRKSLTKKLGEKGKVIDNGHPLTQLKGRYYIHRVVFKNEAAAKLLLDEAKRVSRSNMPPFTDWPQLKVMNIGKKIFLAKQSRELLLTLRLATSDEEAPESLPNPEASGH